MWQNRMRITRAETGGSEADREAEKAVTKCT